MNNFSPLILGLLTLSPLTAQVDAPPAPAKSNDVWFADFDKAVEAATAQKKDLLVDFTGSDWCGWCIKLHEEVFAHDAFLQSAQKSFVLVALDFPNAEEIKAKVPNPKRNQELAQKYGVQGYPTVLLMTPAGDVFGKSGYAPGGPEKYAEAVNGMLETGKRRMAEVASLTASFTKVKEGKERDAVVATAVTMLAGMTGEDVGVDKVADIAKHAVASTDAAIVEQAVNALVKAGHADAETQTKGFELDPKNEKGLYEMIVKAKMVSVQDDDSAKAFLGDLDKLIALGAKNKETLTEMLFNAMRWTKGPLRDEDAAKKWATALEKHVDGTPDAQKYADMIKQVRG